MDAILAIWLPQATLSGFCIFSLFKVSFFLFLLEDAFLRQNQLETKPKALPNTWKNHTLIKIIFC